MDVFKVLSSLATVLDGGSILQLSSVDNEQPSSDPEESNDILQMYEPDLFMNTSMKTWKESGTEYSLVQIFVDENCTRCKECIRSFASSNVKFDQHNIGSDQAWIEAILSCNLTETAIKLPVVMSGSAIWWSSTPTRNWMNLARGLYRIQSANSSSKASNIEEEVPQFF